MMIYYYIWWYYYRLHMARERARWRRCPCSRSQKQNSAHL